MIIKIPWGYPRGTQQKNWQGGARDYIVHSIIWSLTCISYSSVAWKHTDPIPTTEINTLINKAITRHLKFSKTEDGSGGRYWIFELRVAVSKYIYILFYLKTVKKFKPAQSTSIYFLCKGIFIFIFLADFLGVASHAIHPPPLNPPLCLFLICTYWKLGKSYDEGGGGRGDEESMESALPASSIFYSRFPTITQCRKKFLFLPVPATFKILFSHSQTKNFNAQNGTTSTRHFNIGVPPPGYDLYMFIS